MPSPPIELTPLSMSLPNFNKLVFFIDPPSFGEGFAQGGLGEPLAWGSRGKVLPNFGDVPPNFGEVLPNFGEVPPSFGEGFA
jgi:hypothetical protein